MYSDPKCGRGRERWGEIDGRRFIKYGGVALPESLLEGFVILSRHSDTAF